MAENVLLTLIEEAVADSYVEGAGVVVSGGIDSSTICMVTRKLYGDIPTFTGYYNEPGFDERRYARLVAGSRHYEIEIKPEHFLHRFDDMLQHLTFPIQGPGMFGQYIVSMFARLEANVLLSGEGSDELFGGYARLMAVAGHSMPDGYENYTPPWDYPSTVEEALQYDFDRLPDLLAVDEGMSGAWGIDARSPFTDDRIVSWALAQDPQLRVGKVLLKQAVRGLVPDPIINRTDKMGFPIPLVKWAQGPLHDFFHDRIGYIPTLDNQFTRGWWNELVEASLERQAA